MAFPFFFRPGIVKSRVQVADPDTALVSPKSQIQHPARVLLLAAHHARRQHRLVVPAVQLVGPHRPIIRPRLRIEEEVLLHPQRAVQLLLLSLIVVPRRRRQHLHHEVRQPPPMLRRPVHPVVRERHVHHRENIRCHGLPLTALDVIDERVAPEVHVPASEVRLQSMQDVDHDPSLARAVRHGPPVRLRISHPLGHLLGRIGSPERHRRSPRRHRHSLVGHATTPADRQPLSERSIATAGSDTTAAPHAEPGLTAHAEPALRPEPPGARTAGGGKPPDRMLNPWRLIGSSEDAEHETVSAMRPGRGCAWLPAAAATVSTARATSTEGAGRRAA